MQMRIGVVVGNTDDRCASATADGRTVAVTRYTEPKPDHAILLQQMKLHLPAQSPPRIARSSRSMTDLRVVPAP
jgi:hypothetical protein